MENAVLLRFRQLNSPREPKPLLPPSSETRVPFPSLFIQNAQAQYRGTLQATAVASAGALHAARRCGNVPQFRIRLPSKLSKCCTLVPYKMSNGKTLILKDNSEKRTSLSRPTGHKVQTDSTTPMSQSVEDGLAFNASAFERSEKRIDFIVQQILPSIPHLVSVPTKTPYVREFPNENHNTPFDDWEVQDLQHMTLVSENNRGVAWVRGDWQEEPNLASPYSGLRSGTATPRSERDANRIRTKISLADYKAIGGSYKKPTITAQAPKAAGSQTVSNGQTSVPKVPVSPTQQRIDEIIEKSKKLVPKFSDDHPIDIKRPPRPDPPYISDAPHPSPLPKPQRQAEEGRAVWPASDKPDWKQPREQEGLSVQRAKPKRSDFAIMPTHPQHPSNQQKRLEIEQKRQKIEEKQASKKAADKQQPLNSAKEPVSKQPRNPKVTPGNMGKGEAVSRQSNKTQNINDQMPATSARASTPSKQPNNSGKSSEKAYFDNGRPMKIDVNFSGPINAMPPLLSPLPAGLISPDHPGLDDDTVSPGAKPNHITPPNSTKSKNADAGPAELTQQDVVSPLDSPFEMPRMLSPLPESFWEEIKRKGEKVRLHDLEALEAQGLEVQASTTATLGARRERSRQPDTPGVARKTAKPNKAKSNLGKDHTAVDLSTFYPTKATESIDKPNKKSDSSGADREKLMVKLKYGKRNRQTISRLLQMTARPAVETKVLPAPAHPPVGSESKKHGRHDDDTDEPFTKRNKSGKLDAPFSVSSDIDLRKIARHAEDTEEPSAKRPKLYNKDASAPTLSRSETRKHTRAADDIEEPSTKRPKVAGNTDVQRARTPLTPSAQSPAPSTSQKTFSTPKKGDAMKSVAMRRVDSNDGQALTPHGGSVSTPASTEKPRTSGGDVIYAEIDALKALHAKYTTVGTALKRQADQILKVKEKDPGPVSDEEKRHGAVVAVEAVVAYMVAFDSMDKSRHKERKVGHAEQWSSFLPFMIFATERAKAQGEVFTLALLLNAVSRECLERIFVERLNVEPAGTSPVYLKELAKNSQLRQSAWSAYHDQCKDHPVDFTISIEEAKGIAVTVLADYCKKMDISWETKLEF